MCVLHRTDSSVAKLSRRHISMSMYLYYCRLSKVKNMPTKEQPIYVLVPSTISSAERHFLFSEQRLAKLILVSTSVCS